MSFSRRHFLSLSGLSAGALLSRPRLFAGTGPRIALDVNTLAHWVDPLPIPPLARPHSGHAYRVAMTSIEASFHRDLPPAQVWAYGGSSPGPTFDVRQGQPIQVEWVNSLPTEHFLPIDTTLHGAEPGVPAVRAVVHLHGARVPTADDGYPTDWYVPGRSRVCHYPNRQDAAMLFYHDHAMGINRLNVFAGLFGAYLLRDDAELALGLPNGELEIPLVIYDRQLDRQGQLYYPVSDDPKSPWIPEFFGNALVINGKLWPDLEVEPRTYRFRALNVSNTRFLNLSLSSNDVFHQIGGDQGLLPQSVPLKIVDLAPAERADLIVDFSGRAGQQLFFKNDVVPVMRIRVAGRARGPAAAVPPRPRAVVRTPESAALKTRRITLTEYSDAAERPILMLMNDNYWHDPVTETPALDSTEIWEFLNTTEDSHPIHLHLVRFQILDRRSFDVDAFLASKTLRYIDPLVSPEANEYGWKDTVKAHGGMVTRIIVKFEGYRGKYLYHCHILEHEAKDMMRPYEVI